MDSLFEGMVLFSPSQEAIAEPDEVNQWEQSSTTTTESNVDTIGNGLVSASVPLDENLFSDLTVVSTSEIPGQSEDRPLSPPVAVNQRQSSIRKKKKAGGLRIGYGRDRNGPNSYAHSDELNESHVSTSQQGERQDRDSDYRYSSVITVVDKHHDPYSVNDHISVSLATEDANVANSPCTIRDLQVEEENGGVDNANTTFCSSGSSTFDFKYEELRKRISENLKHAQEAVTNASAARKDSIRRRRKVAEKLSQASAKHRELEKELEEACETEDFEKAERVSESLSSAEEDREALVSAYKDAEDHCDKLDSKMKEALEYQIQAEEECASLLQNFAMDALHNADSFLESAKEFSSKEMEKWLSSTEAVELHKMELDIEYHLVNEARSGLKSYIEQSVADDQEERDLLYKRRDILREDLLQLLLLVKEKEAEISENDSSIERVEKKIAGVLSGFQGAHSSLDTMTNDLQSSLYQVESEYELLSKRKKDTEKLLFEDETKGKKIREISRVSTDEANMIQEVAALRKNLLQFILQSMEDKLRLTKTEEKLSEDVQKLRQGISGARASLQELSSSKLSTQQKVESLKQRLLFIEKRVPELEAEKKVSATARNFREAARIAAEAKTLSVEKEGLEINIENARFELKKLEEQIDSTIKELQETESQVLSKEKELAVSRFQRLTLIADATGAERSAALELGDLEEAEALLAEAEASSAEAIKIQLLYDLRDEDVSNLPKYLLPMELVSKLGREQLAELVKSMHISAC